MYNKLKIVTAVAATLLSANSFATSAPLSGKFTTLQAVSIAPTATELVINGLQLQNGDQCILAAGIHTGGASYLGDVVMRLGGVGTNPAGSATTTTTGTGCVASTASGGTIGLYEITGAPGATVNITIEDSVVGSDITLVPAGCAGNYVAGADGDTCTIVSKVAPASVRLAGSTDTGGLGEGIPISGTTLVALGATATVLNPLTAGDSYPIGFEINVTY